MSVGACATPNIPATASDQRTRSTSGSHTQVPMRAAVNASRSSSSCSRTACSARRRPVMSLKNPAKRRGEPSAPRLTAPARQQPPPLAVHPQAEFMAESPGALQRRRHRRGRAGAVIGMEPVLEFGEDPTCGSPLMMRMVPDAPAGAGRAARPTRPGRGSAANGRAVPATRSRSKRPSLDPPTAARRRSRWCVKPPRWRGWR